MRKYGAVTERLFLLVFPSLSHVPMPTSAMGKYFSLKFILPATSMLAHEPAAFITNPTRSAITAKPPNTGLGSFSTAMFFPCLSFFTFWFSSST